MPATGLGLAAWLILVVLFGAHVWVNAIVLSRLRSNHPAQWRELGSPTMILNNSIANNFRMLRFIHLGQYRRLEDPDLESLFVLLRILNAIAYAALFVTIVVWVVQR